jgi:hypothetical protein
MNKYTVKTQAWVSYEGDYSNDGDVLLFDQASLTPDQWSMVWQLDANSRFDYVKAVLDGRSLTEWEL